MNRARELTDYARRREDRCGAPHPGNRGSRGAVACTRHPHDDPEHNYRNDWASSPRFEWTS